jgi:hypothetical protein
MRQSVLRHTNGTLVPQNQELRTTCVAKVFNSSPFVCKRKGPVVVIITLSEPACGLHATALPLKNGARQGADRRAWWAKFKGRNTTWRHLQRNPKGRDHFSASLGCR